MGSPGTHHPQLRSDALLSQAAGHKKNAMNSNTQIPSEPGWLLVGNQIYLKHQVSYQPNGGIISLSMVLDACLGQVTVSVWNECAKAYCNFTVPSEIWDQVAQALNSAVEMTL